MINLIFLCLNEKKTLFISEILLEFFDFIPDKLYDKLSPDFKKELNKLI